MDPYRQTCFHQPQPYACQYHPGREIMPSQMRMDAFPHPPAFVPSHFSDNFSHPNSCSRNGYCSHICPPGHSMRPQFFYAQPSPQPYFYGPYAPYPNTYPAYIVPPPHYSVDQARYDYDKNHCCGCQPHTCHQRDDNPKFEEQKSVKEQDKDPSGLIWLPNYPSPIYVPKSSIKDREGNKDAQLPGSWNGWVPLDINNLKWTRDEDEEKKSLQGENKRGQGRSPFPIVWMPGYDKPEGEAKDLKDISPKSGEDWPRKLQIVPFKFLEDEDHEKRSGTIHETSKSDVEPEVHEEKKRKIKPIPVEHLEETIQEKTSMPEKQEEKADVEQEVKEEKKSKIKLVPVEHLEETIQEKTSMPEKQEEKADEKKVAASAKNKEREGCKASEKKQSSPVKSSKLPPVCLRVDPLPRKKTTNGKSRSPSPPGCKDEENHQNNVKQNPQQETSVKVTEKVIPVVEVKDDNLSHPVVEQKCQKKLPADRLEGQSQTIQETTKSNKILRDQKVIEDDKGPERKESTETERELKIEVEKGNVESPGSKEVQKMSQTKRDLPETDAAVIIQSVFRGFQVRRWQPLEKLSKIAKICDQASSIRKQIETGETRSKELDAKQRLVIGETIMNLLLQLDTIQGLHPSVREYRKTVARELISLQEKLDSLCKQNAEGHELTKAEEERKTTDVEASANSSVDSSKQEAFQQDSLEYMTDLKPTQIDLDIGGLPSKDEVFLPSDEEVPLVASQSSLMVEVPKHEAVQLAEENHEEDKPSFNDEECSKSEAASGREANPFLVTESASEQGIVQPVPSFSEVSPVASQSSPDEGVPKHEAMQLAGQNNEEGKPFSGDDECARPDTENIASEAACGQNTNLSLAAESRLGQGTEVAEEIFTSGTLYAENKEHDSNQERDEDVTQGKEAAAGSKEITDASLACEVLCEKDESVNASMCVDEDFKMLSSGHAVDHEMKDLLKPSQEVRPEEHEAIANDLGNIAEGDTGSHHEMEQGPAQSLEQCCNREEFEERAIDTGESVLCDAEDGLEHNMISSLEPKEDDQIMQEGLPMMLEESARVEESMHGEDTPMPTDAMMLDDVKQIIPESLEEVAAISNARNEDGNVFAEVVSEERSDSSVVGQQACDLVINGGSFSSPAVLEAVDGEVDKPEQKEICGILTNTGSNANKEKQLLEENEKLREMLEKILEAGKEQSGVISTLNKKVNDLEKKLARKKRSVKAKRGKASPKIRPLELLPA